jgi:thymidine phosphorylase
MTFLPQEIIRRKRDGLALSQAEIAEFIAGLTDGRIGDAQVGAFAMAVLLRGMTTAETVALTLAMRDSGEVLDWRALGVAGPVVDKHSTGGVGDKVSLILGPLLAACGAHVPMISGRGLGHTGGSVDKLEAIPGYRVAVDRDTFVRVVRDIGVAIVGATAEFAPADRRLYGIRDITATVESIPLITASILSKKFAEGTPALAMDVKFGSGAFMAELDSARALARSIVETGNGAGVPTVALLTDMDQVLGRTAGNALEVAESLAFLTGSGRDPRLAEVTLALTAEALVLAGLAQDTAAAHTLAQARLDDGSAAEKFARMVAALGGPTDVFARDVLPRAPVERPVYPDSAGFLAGLDVRAIGLAVVRLGGGRTAADQGIDPRVGLSAFVGLGEMVDRQRPICVVHAADETTAARAADEIRAAIRVADTPPVAPRPVRERVT